MRGLPTRMSSAVTSPPALLPHSSPASLYLRSVWCVAFVDLYGLRCALCRKNTFACTHASSKIILG